MHRLAAIVGVSLLGSNLSLAGDVLYKTWEDDQSQIWIIIQNEMDRPIRVKKMSMVFYDQKGRPIKEYNQECKEDCIIRSHDSTDVGPFPLPENSHSTRVRYIQYSIE